LPGIALVSWRLITSLEILNVVTLVTLQFVNILPVVNVNINKVFDSLRHKHSVGKFSAFPVWREYGVVASTAATRDNESD
jgi:hypothetical protein